MAECCIEESIRFLEGGERRCFNLCVEGLVLILEMGGVCAVGTMHLRTRSRVFLLMEGGDGLKCAVCGVPREGRGFERDGAEVQNGVVLRGR